MQPIYPFPAPPKPTELIEVFPSIFWLRLELPFALNHINVYLIREQNGYLLIDTGFNNADTQEIWEKVLTKLEAPLNRLFITHFHPDHLGLAHWLQSKTNADLFMSLGEFLTAHALFNATSSHAPADILAQLIAHGLTKKWQEKFTQTGNLYRESVPHLPLYYERVREGDLFAINQENWQVLSGFGHSPEHLMLFHAEKNILIGGDMLLPRISTNVPVYPATPLADSLGDFLGSLQKLSEVINEKTLILPSHGMPFYGGLTRIKALFAHHEERLAVLQEACEKPQCAANLLEILFGREMSDVRQTLFAMGEAIAHLNHLETQQKLKRSVDANGVFHFVAQ